MKELKDVFNDDELLNAYLEDVILSDFRAEVSQLVEEKLKSTNNTRQQVLREIAGDIDCWIRRINQVGDLMPVHVLLAWHRQLQPLL